MAENLGLDSARSMTPNYAHGLSILLVDHDITSLKFLTHMLEQYSYKVMSVELARLAVSTIDEQPNEFKLIIANPEMPDMDANAFLMALLQKDIPLIQMRTSKASEFLTRGTCFCLEKPVSVNDIKYLWQHALYKKNDSTLAETINDTDRLEKLMNDKSMKDATRVETVNSPQNPRPSVDPNGKDYAVPENVTKGCLKDDQIEAFRAAVKMQKTDRSWSNSKGKRPITHEMIRYEKNQKRRKFENRETNYNRASKIAIDHEETKKEEAREKAEENGSNGSPAIRRRGGVWNAELHRKFTAALCALGDKNARPKSILQIMNVPNLTQRQVASHLQKYKAQVQRLSETTPVTRDLKSTNKTLDYPSNYDYPFKISNLTKNLLKSNSSWHTLGSRNSSSSFSKPGCQSLSTSSKMLGSLQQKTSQFSITLQKLKQFPSTANRRPEFCLGGKINLHKLPLFASMMNNSSSTMAFRPVPPTTGSALTPMTVSNLSATYVPVPSAAAYNPCCVPETNVNQIVQVPASATYNPPAYFFSLNGYVPELDQMGLVPSAESYIPPEYTLQSSGCAPETDLNQMGSVPAASSYIPPGCFLPSGGYVLETNVNQMGLVPSGESSVPLNNTIPSATSYRQGSAFSPMDSVPHTTTPHVRADSLTPPSGSGSQYDQSPIRPMEFSEILKLLDMDHMDGTVSGRNGEEDVDEFFDCVNDYLNESDAAA